MTMFVTSEQKQYIYINIARPRCVCCLQLLSTPRHSPPSPAPPPHPATSHTPSLPCAPVSSPECPAEIHTLVVILCETNALPFKVCCTFSQRMKNKERGGGKCQSLLLSDSDWCECKGVHAALWTRSSRVTQQTSNG